MLKSVISKIPPHIRLLLKLYVFNLLLFTGFRLVFYHVNKSSDVSQVPLTEKLMAFRMGLEFDTAVFCWIAFIPVLILSVASFFKNNPKIFDAGFYSFLILLLVYYLVMAADIPYFRQFGTHLNKNALLWNENPRFIIGMIFGNIYYWAYLLLFIGVSFLSVRISLIFYKNFKKEIKTALPQKFIINVVAFLILSALTTLGARGRTSDRSGLHEGLSIVSQNGFINQIAINPNFTFWKTLFYNKNQEPYKVPANINQSIAYTRKYLGIETPYKPSLEREIQDTFKNKYNFVIVIMESMSVYKMGYYGGKNLTPNLDQLVKKSIFFNNFFSSGIHTFNGLFSTTSGYPGIFAEKSMKSYVKKPFNGLGSLLKQLDYETYCYTTHDPHFDNMHGFFKLNKFDHFISEYDFDFSQAESSLGVPDHLLFNRLIDVTNARKESSPFVAVLMTASDHGPWRIPKDIPFTPNGANEQENCTLYADWSIGRFMEQASKQDWYKNTVFMFLGDHGLSMGHTYEMPISYNHVPFIIHQPAIFKADTITSPAYQPDVPATVMGIIGANYINNSFGINVLKQKHPFVVFSADDKIGCVDDKGYYFYKTLANNQTYLRKYKNLDPFNYTVIRKEKADSMHKNMMMIYESATYFINKEYASGYY
ncbi:MAG: sulfatase-like hydrolase/transferase [Bacteroidetes bacterium]|nr:sulfatase-like hydrolase/transferase [Bacteroidota bacterium]